MFAPYWRDDARGVIVGLTAYANRGHIARAALEATAWQSREGVDEAWGNLLLLEDIRPARHLGVACSGVDREVDVVQLFRQLSAPPDPVN